MKWASGGTFFACQLVVAICGAAPPSAQFPDAAEPTTKPATSTTPAPQPTTAPAGSALGTPPPAPPGMQPAPSAAPPPAAYPPPPPGYYPPPPGYYPPPPAPAAEAPRREDEIVTLSISPLHLILPIVELQAEARVTPHFGVAVIGGYGKITETVVNGVFDTSSVQFNAYELGGQLVGYPLRSFQSLQLGAELLWLKVDTSGVPAGSVRLSGSAQGVAVGPLVGYKLITRVGFTFFVQGGFEYIAARAKANDSNGNNATASQNSYIPLLNANVGWSF